MYSRSPKSDMPLALSAPGFHSTTSGKPSFCSVNFLELPGSATCAKIHIFVSQCISGSRHRAQLIHPAHHDCVWRFLVNPVGLAAYADCLLRLCVFLQIVCIVAVPQPFQAFHCHLHTVAIQRKRCGQNEVQKLWAE